MRLLDLHNDVQLLVAQARLSVGHAKAILSIKDHDAQLLASDQILRRQLTVRAAEKLAQSFLAGNTTSADGKKTAPAPRETDIHIRAITNRLREAFATHVAVHHTPKKGRIEIEYYGDDDLQRILELLGLPEGD
jgi:ParB family chromosome partitioning protein